MERAKDEETQMRRSRERGREGERHVSKASGTAPPHSHYFLIFAFSKYLDILKLKFKISKWVTQAFICQFYKLSYKESTPITQISTFLLQHAALLFSPFLSPLLLLSQICLFCIAWLFQNIINGNILIIFYYLEYRCTLIIT